MLDGNGVVYCDRAFASTYGKTAHGLVRFTERYTICSVIDRDMAGQDAFNFLDGKNKGIPIVSGLIDAFRDAEFREIKLTHFIIGIAPDGGTLNQPIRTAVIEALKCGLNVDSGLHDYLQDDFEIRTLAAEKNLKIRDIRKPRKGQKHFFTGKIEEVQSKRIALLGTDSAIGKRTTAWILVHALRKQKISAELIGTGQTAWMQGVRFGVVMDSLQNDYVSGELEHTLWMAWKESSMEYAIIEGQGSLMNPGYPGGFEILAACRPHGIVMQHAPFRKEYDGFPGYPLDPLADQIHMVEFLSKRPVVGITINHEGIPEDEIDRECRTLEDEIMRPVIDPLIHGVDRLIPFLKDLK